MGRKGYIEPNPPSISVRTNVRTFVSDSHESRCIIYLRCVSQKHIAALNTQNQLATVCQRAAQTTSALSATRKPSATTISFDLICLIRGMLQASIASGQPASRSPTLPNAGVRQLPDPSSLSSRSLAQTVQNRQYCRSGRSCDADAVRDLFERDALALEPRRTQSLRRAIND